MNYEWERAIKQIVSDYNNADDIVNALDDVYAKAKVLDKITEHIDGNYLSGAESDSYDSGYADACSDINEYIVEYEHEQQVKIQRSIAFGDNLKIIRKNKGFTQQEIANNTGLSRSYLSDLENGYKNPSIKTIKGIARKLGVSVNELINDDITINHKEEKHNG